MLIAFAFKNTPNYSIEIETPQEVAPVMHINRRRELLHVYSLLFLCFLVKSLQWLFVQVNHVNPSCLTLFISS